MSQLGVEQLLQHRRDLLKGRRVGLVSNYTVTDSGFRPVIRLFAESDDWHLTKLFGPEHGVKNSAKEGEEVDTTVDEATGLPAYSLYGPHKKPTPEMLEGLDVLVIDLVDIGARYYTNMNTLAYCMEACGELGLPCVVPDRPNPINGVTREGNILDPAFTSFVGMHLIPNRHGLTMGELAGFINSRLPSPCELTVVEMTDWTRDMLLTDTGLPFVPSSPNTTSLDMALLYPGTCFFEGVNVSLGRGTVHPFEYVGAPYMKAHVLTDWFNAQEFPGVVARPIYFVPTYSQYTGELCEGISLHVTAARSMEPVRMGVVLLQGLAELYEQDFAFLGLDKTAKPFIDLLAGTSKLRTYVQAGRALDYLDEAEGDLEQFNQEIKPFELYATQG
ncbi:exo-beta-N-acetylmuramidase NamZ family protein [Alicyclobacillus dauci]|uniref:DUF1343 domain-containing protein n=1 Tax=Alicyclobacillus dauci TaxID=1475485 RepID=A0ABY6Z4I0_9BACL|nr:DUF1343 domain-containing protein [Alicyclobacillus dauci]WAH37184.1 DUF1343 domain-containing protein [Alicyclobacillus dauci]